MPYHADESMQNAVSNAVSNANAGDLSKIPEQLQRLVGDLGWPAQSEATGPGAKEAITGAAEAVQVEPALSQGWSGWIVALVVGLVLVAVAGLWWWQRHRKRQAAVIPAQPPEFDPLGDWNRFRQQLAPKMKRVLDDFQPVIVLGDVASERERVIRQLAGVEDSLRLHGASAAASGKALQIYLGDCALIVAPTQEFCQRPGSFSDPGWQSVLRRVGRVRPPRVVVCLSAPAVDLGGTPDLTDWMGTLRQHVSVVAAVRGEDVEVHPVLAEPPCAGRAGVKASSTEVLFELVAELTAHEGSDRAQRVEITSLGSGRTEEGRVAAGQQWAERLLWTYYRGWTKLLARPGQSAEHTLALVRLFERIPILASGLGAALAELFADVSGAAAPKGLRQQLLLLPSDGDRLCGALPAFGPPENEESEVPWYPSARLRHRLWVASAATAMAAALYAAFHFDRLQWQRAATASLSFDPPDPVDFKVVEDYVKHRLHGADQWAPNFFNRDLPRSRVVEKVRKYLADRMNSPPSPKKPTPEAQLQLLGMYMAGTPSTCVTSQDRATYAEFMMLTELISQNVEQWSLLTDLTHREVAGYLDIACPDSGSNVLKDVLLRCAVQPEDARALGAGARAGGVGAVACERDPVPDAASFAAALSSLSGRCALEAQELEAIRRAHDIQREMSLVGREHGAAKLVLDAASWINHDTTRLLVRAFTPDRDRLSAIHALAAEDEDIRLLIADVRPYLDAHDAGGEGRCADGLCTLRGLTERLEGLVTVPPRTGMLSLEIDSQTYVIDRKSVRDGLEAAAFERLVAAFIRQSVEAESIFFGSELQHAKQRSNERGYQWYRATIPSGLWVRTRVSPNYTISGFEEFVRPDLDKAARYVEALACLKTEGAPEQRPFRAPDELRKTVDSHLSSYVFQYAKTWRTVYDSFRIDPQIGAKGLAQVIEVLSRPKSPQLEMIRTVLAQTTLQAPTDPAYGERIESVASEFGALAPVADEAVFDGYRELLRGLLEQLVTAPPVTIPASLPEDAAAAREQFGERLSGLGKVTWLELVEPATALRARVTSWLSENGVGAGLQRPFLEPFDAAARLGERQLLRAVAEWWRPMEKRLQGEVLSRFPFAPDARTEVELETLIQWLHPTEGKLTLEVAPVLEGLGGCAACRQGLDAEVYERARVIQAALFEKDGQPRALPLTLQPVPFAAQKLAPKKVSLTVDQTRHDYFNTEPRPFELFMRWDEPHAAELRVELADGPGAREGVAPRIASTGSPWSLLRVLRRGAPVPGAGADPGAPSDVYRFSLLAGDSGSRVQVSYRVCAWATRCGGLFSEVLKW